MNPRFYFSQVSSTFPTPSSCIIESHHPPPPPSSTTIARRPSLSLPLRASPLAMLFKAVRHARPFSPPPTHHNTGNHPDGGGGDGGGDMLVNPCLASLLLPALHCIGGEGRRGRRKKIGTLSRPPLP
ncbi:hypothetical protein NL676_039813 [Syzygium grande]|nr:hypothetical protein NL676_039813 [Syzygium grande]